MLGERRRPQILPMTRERARKIVLAPVWRLAFSGLLVWAGLASGQMTRDAESIARQTCAERWPNDFDMQAWCLKNQAKGYRDLVSFYDNSFVQYDPAEEERKARLHAKTGYRDPGSVDLCPPPHRMTQDGCQ
jgi:hypothetical protein